MYDADEPEEPRGKVDWDAWEKNRLSGRGKWWLIWAVLMLGALTAQQLSHHGAFWPR
ncbi:hypothetical protein [Aquihabitans sp. McL0605]|uniref:hypothetical protein n=1 Tax=Aquihabitans sp. McL0605 TaxID=3415671 RepID=UPI003CEED5D7